ncbi:stage III sporulation protein AG [Clostridium omnivorum]|uniref:Stage III sporulation protein AG n=1 Tax=Clostridium omnivorum TaxID=1604902 RepID=A0ABQ5NAY4_9CLOT|nr:stage III sporulation protein AG [Clostridium sp. E14]GLC32429.1 stage III sporulation protein AG [Clostridium sp. E14]
MNLKKILEKLLSKDKKSNLINLTIIALIAILVVIGTNIFKSTGSAETNETSSKNQQAQKASSSSDDYEAVLENKLKTTLEQIQGVGRVNVMITFESGEEQVPAINVNDSTSTTEEKDGSGGIRTNTQKTNGSTIVVTNDGSKNEPLIVKTYKPKVVGVCVVAEGADNKATEYNISKAVVKLFNLSMDKVNVYPMKK